MQHGKRTGSTDFWWAVHNLIAHPLSEILHWVRLRRLSDWIHDETVPLHEAGTGRG